MFNKTKIEIIEKSKSVKNLTVFQWKKFIKKRALKRIKKILNIFKKRRRFYN